MRNDEVRCTARMRDVLRTDIIKYIAQWMECHQKISCVGVCREWRSALIAPEFWSRRDCIDASIADNKFVINIMIRDALHLTPICLSYAILHGSVTVLPELIKQYRGYIDNCNENIRQTCDARTRKLILGYKTLKHDERYVIVDALCKYNVKVDLSVLITYILRHKSDAMISIFVKYPDYLSEDELTALCNTNSYFMWDTLLEHPRLTINHIYKQKLREAYLRKDTDLVELLMNNQLMDSHNDKISLYI